MGKIHINKEVSKKGKKYEVFVNHFFYHFTNERAARDFIRSVDNYLQEQFELLNVNLVNVYAISRRLSWYLTSSENIYIRIQIKSVEEAIELTVRHAEMPNYSSFSFDKLGVSIDTLTRILESMEEVCKSKKYTVISAEIRAALSSCNLQLYAAQKFDFKNKKHKGLKKRLRNTKKRYNTYIQADSS